MIPSPAIRATSCPFCDFTHPVASMILDHIWRTHAKENR